MSDIKPNINTITDTRGMICSFCGGTVYSALQLSEDRFVCGERVDMGLQHIRSKTLKMILGNKGEL